MGVEFNFDEMALRRVVERGMREDVMPKVQGVFDSVYESHAGKSVADIKQELSQRWSAIGTDWNLREPLLTQYAEAIARGRRVQAELVME